MQQKETIVVFCSREICYNSSNFFANQIADAFEQLGYEAVVCEFTQEDDLDAILTPFYGKKYKLLLDFNSAMTRMVEEDGTPILDLMDGPFYNYVLDHPLFHYNALNADLKNLNAIFVDEAQEMYVKQYYKKVHHTITMPLGATEGMTWQKKEKKIEKNDAILFMGTYDNPDFVYELVKLSPKPLQDYMKQLIDIRLENPLLPMEEAFRHLLKEEGRELSTEEFALYMNHMYPVDVFIRDYFRKIAIDELARKKVNVTLVGDGWEKYKSPREECITRENAVMFSLSFERIAQANLLLNVSPFFNHGAHDRIFAGMANQCVVLTDENPYLKRNLKDGTHLCMYSLKDMTTLSELAKSLIEQPKLCEQIQQQAYLEFQEKYTWQKKAQQLLDAITYS